MSEPRLRPGMSAAAASRLEYFIIGIGVVALILIFQPFTLTLFGVGCGLVVVAALANNLLPLCEPGVPLRSIGNAVLIIALIFAVAVAISIGAAYLYGQLFIGGH
jgi:hypothetical protein